MGERLKLITEFPNRQPVIIKALADIDDADTRQA